MYTIEHHTILWKGEGISEFPYTFLGVNEVGMRMKVLWKRIFSLIGTKYADLWNNRLLRGHPGVMCVIMYDEEHIIMDEVDNYTCNNG